jgi:deoxyribonuclease-4
MTFKKLLFGTAGIPISTPNRGTVEGIKHVKALGLSGMELEFVYGITVSEQKAPEVKKAALESDVVLTCHGSYYVNLNSAEKEKIEASIGRIVTGARRAEEAGAVSMTFHSGFYSMNSPTEVFKTMKKKFEEITKELKSTGNKITIRPETTGKPTQFGSINELISLCAELDNVLPCIDFSHLHARSNGKYNTYDEFRKVLEDSEKALGKAFLKNMHCHVSGINYSLTGEKNHLILKDSDFNYKDLLKALKDMDAAGIIVSESPNLEGDALLMKKTFESL